MHLRFKFKYLSKNHTYIKFLEGISKDFGLEYKIFKDDEEIFLYVNAKEELLEEFSNELSLRLPMSLFFYGLEVDVVENMPSKNSLEVNNNQVISFCPSCLKEVENNTSKDYYNAFKKCKVCTNYKDGKFIFDGKEEKSDNKLFENLAKLISEGKRIKIKTLSGEFVFSKVQNLNDTQELLVTNLANISKLVVEKKTDVVALVSIEKPSIEFKINEIYKHKHKIEKEFINVRVANDLTLYLLSKELIKYEIDFLQIEKDSIEANHTLEVYSKEKIVLDIPKVKCFENKKLFLKSSSYPKNLDEIYNKFEQKDKAHFMTVLAENRLFDKSIINFYVSSKDNDGFLLYSPKFDGLVDLYSSFKLPKTVAEIFDNIKKEETGKRLLENYMKEFPNDYEKAVNSDISSFDKNSFYNYWKIAKIVLNFENEILDNANNCSLEKGPRIDYKVKKSEKIYNKEFYFEKMIKSALSFKLAGVDEVTISLGYIESFAHFIANEVDNINSSYELDGISLCGDMFASDLFVGLVEKSITKNFKIYYNREFVIQK